MKIIYLNFFSAVKLDEQISWRQSKWFPRRKWWRSRWEGRGCHLWWRGCPRTWLVRLWWSCRMWECPHRSGLRGASSYTDSLREGREGVGEREEEKIFILFNSAGNWTEFFLNPSEYCWYCLTSPGREKASSVWAVWCSSRWVMKTPSQAGRQSGRNSRIRETQSSCSGLHRVASELTS